MDRREFLKRFAKEAAAAGFIFYAVKVSVPVLADEKDSSDEVRDPADAYNWEDHYYGMVINISQCIGCYTCMRACRDENDVGERGYRTWVERYTISEDNTVTISVPDCKKQKGPRGLFEVPPEVSDGPVREQFFVPKLCNHCEKPPCVQVCPVGATYQTRDGVVLIDHESCVGCAYCIQACPYGARFWDEKFLCANKCSFCYHRITHGKPPACVLACPRGVRVFGDLKDPNSPLYEALHREKATMLKRTLGTEPKVYYTDIHKEIV